MELICYSILDVLYFKIMLLNSCYLELVQTLTIAFLCALRGYIIIPLAHEVGGWYTGDTLSVHPPLFFPGHNIQGT